MPRFCFLKSSQGIHRKKPKRKRCFGKSSWPQTAIGVASIGDPIHPTSQHHPLLEALGRGPFRRSLRRVMQAQNMQRKEENITSAFTKLGTHPEVSCMKSLKIAQCLGGLIEFGRRFNGRECFFSFLHDYYVGVLLLLLCGRSWDNRFPAWPSDVRNAAGPMAAENPCDATSSFPSSAWQGRRINICYGC